MQQRVEIDDDIYNDFKIICKEKGLLKGFVLNEFISEAIQKFVEKNKNILDK